MRQGKGGVLIINYDLGTKNGVGGRRWALLGRALLEAGEQVHFLTTRQDLPEELQEWSTQVHTFKTKYPACISQTPNNLFGKLQYRWWRWRLLQAVRGTIYDLGKRDEQRFLSNCRRLIQQHGIDVCIVTGAPFSYLYYGTLLKKEFPGLVLVSDFRDKWTEGFNYGMRQLDARRMDYERACELAVIQQSDLVTVASEDVGDYLNQRHARAYMVLYNAVSPILEQAAAQKAKPAESAGFHLVHVGNISEGCEDQTEHLIRAIKVLEKQKPGLVKLSLVGLPNPEVVQQFNKAGISGLQLIQRMPQQELGAWMNTADAFLIFNREALAKSIPTKFFDYIVFKKPIIAYDIKGKLAQMIRERRIGILLNTAHDAEQTAAMLQDLAGGTQQFNLESTHTEFSSAQQVRLLLEALNPLLHQQPDAFTGQN
ncbi:MAG: hypothetical protein RL160_1697 [Bacteroidota bacterium]|jgi:hypothetical protein